MNRRVQWTQSPPDLQDYAPECLEGPAMAPFQQRAPALENESSNHGTKREVEQPSETPTRSAPKVPKIDRGNSASHQGLMCSLKNDTWVIFEGRSHFS